MPDVPVEPHYIDLEESAYDASNIQMGSFANADSDYQPREHEPVEHLHPGPLGFGIPAQPKRKKR